MVYAPFFLLFDVRSRMPAAVVAGRLLHRGGADPVRHFGTWFQLFGLVLVAPGVRELRLEFNQPAILATMGARMGAIIRSLRSGDRTLAVTGVGGIGLAGSAAFAYGRVRGTVEQRLDGLEREIDDLRKQADERQRKLESKLSKVHGELSKETQERMEEHAQIRRKLDNLAVVGCISTA